MTIYEALFKQDLGDWTPALKKYDKNILQISRMIKQKVDQYGEHYPHEENVFKFLKITPLEKVKVVIWGQDPYPTLLPDGTPRAQGYSFGVSREDEVPKSLQNIYREIKDNFSNFQAPDHGDLTWLADQGVLFMNQSLTYSPNNPKAYLNIWNRFIYIIITIINEKVDNCIHLLWGKECEKLAEYIRSREVYITSHPSPMSARRGFLGCKHFLKVNVTLENRKLTKIKDLEKKLKDKKFDEEEIKKEIEEIKKVQYQINWNEDQNLPKTYLESQEES